MIRLLLYVDRLLCYLHPQIQLCSSFDQQKKTNGQKYFHFTSLWSQHITQIALRRHKVLIQKLLELKFGMKILQEHILE